MTVFPHTLNDSESIFGFFSIIFRWTAAKQYNNLYSKQHNINIVKTAKEDSLFGEVFIICKMKLYIYFFSLLYDDEIYYYY